MGWDKSHPYSKSNFLFSMAWGVFFMGWAKSHPYSKSNFSFSMAWGVFSWNGINSIPIQYHFFHFPMEWDKSHSYSKIFFIFMAYSLNCLPL